MPRDEAQAGHPESPSAAEATGVRGIRARQSNTTYCPNQFFDVVLPHFARGVVRLVGYVIYRTFAWRDRMNRRSGAAHKFPQSGRLNIR